MTFQLVSDPPRLIGGVSAMATLRLLDSAKEVLTGSQASKTQVNFSKPLVSQSWSGEEIRKLEHDVRKAEELTYTVESFVENIRQASQDDEKARKLDQLTDDPDLSKVINVFEQNFVSDANSKVASLVETVEHWSKFADSRLIKSTLPVPLARRVEQLDRKQKMLADELGKDYDNELILRLFTRVARYRPLTIAETLRLDDAAKLEWKVNEQPSVYRADWYGDDGR